MRRSLTPDRCVLRSGTVAALAGAALLFGPPGANADPVPQPAAQQAATAAQTWQQRRAEFAKLAASARGGDAQAQQAVGAVAADLKAHPFSRTPLENLEIIGFTGLPKDGAGPWLAEIAANLALGWYDALRYGSESARVENAQNENFFKKAFLAGGMDSAHKASKFMKDDADRTKRLVDQGLAQAAPLRDTPNYDHRWPTGYGLEQMQCELGSGSCEPPPVLAQDKWDKAWEDSRQKVLDFFNANSRTATIAKPPFKPAAKP